jgi:hypothetical protein
MGNEPSKLDNVTSVKEMAYHCHWANGRIYYCSRVYRSKNSTLLMMNELE